MHIKHASVIEYDTGKYDFRALACGILGVVDLGQIHRRDDLTLFGPRDVVAQIEVCRRTMAENFFRWEALYADFVNGVLGPLFDGIRAFQRPPSFRFHYSKRGSSSFHRDRDYGVKKDRLNLWVPLTDVWGENSLWVESEEGREDLAPVELSYGQALIFNAGDLLHGSKWNGTESTRVSFDLRFLPRARLNGDLTPCGSA